VHALESKDKDRDNPSPCSLESKDEDRDMSVVSKCSTESEESLPGMLYMKVSVNNVTTDFVLL
jgi:hypothetical protein